MVYFCVASTKIYLYLWLSEKLVAKQLICGTVIFVCRIFAYLRVKLENCRTTDEECLVDQLSESICGWIPESDQSRDIIRDASPRMKRSAIALLTSFRLDHSGHVTPVSRSASPVDRQTSIIDLGRISHERLTLGDCNDVHRSRCHSQ